MALPPHHAAAPRQQIPEDGYMAMASHYPIRPTPPGQQRPAHSRRALPRPKMAHGINMPRQPLQNPSYGQVNRGQQGVAHSDAAPPLPPKPVPRPQYQQPSPHTPANIPPQHHPMEVPLPQQRPMNTQQPLMMGASTNFPPQQPPARPLPDLPPSTAAVPGANGAGEYTYITNPKEQRNHVHHLNSQISDTESRLRERDLELSRCNDELSKSRLCLKEKKDEIKAKDIEIQRLREDNIRLRQSSGAFRPQPQVAQNEAALQSEVQHYKRMVGDLRREMEQLRMQPPPPPLAPAVDHHEMSRLRGEVQWLQTERLELLKEVERLKSAEQILSAQVKTYSEDFRCEREDRERASAKIEKMQEEIDTLNHIVTMLQQPQ